MNKAGRILNKAMTEIETELNRPVVTSQNYIDLTESKNMIEMK